VNKLEQYKNNCEENYDITPISVLRYITELENCYSRSDEIIDGQAGEIIKLNKKVEALEELAHRMINHARERGVLANNTPYEEQLKQIQEGEG
jgi:altronate dehydratase